MENDEIRRAKRKATPLIVSVEGVSSSGKTYSALLLAAGIAGPKGTVGLVDTENGRGEMYEDSPGIRKALPEGYLYTRFDPSFTPRRYVEKITKMQQAGATVVIVDSTSHEWEGIGGCQELAEEKKLRGMPNWALAKMEHKRFVNYLLTADCHLILCLRAREKVRIVSKGAPMTTGLHDAFGLDAPLADKDMIVPIGVQAICEKNLPFEMTLRLYLDEVSHFAVARKVPEPLVPLFDGKRLLTADDGARIREWNETGAALSENERLIQRSQFAAAEGIAAYEEFFKSLTPAQRKALVSVHEQNKRTAREVTERIPRFGSAESPVDWPDSFEGSELMWNGKRLKWNEETGNYAVVEGQSEAA